MDCDGTKLLLYKENHELSDGTKFFVYKKIHRLSVGTKLLSIIIVYKLCVPKLIRFVVVKIRLPEFPLCVIRPNANNHDLALNSSSAAKRSGDLP